MEWTLVQGKPPGSAATFSEVAVVRLGVFELDLRRRELRRKGILIKLHQQPWEILALLVRHRGELVSRELIQQTLWPNGHFVDFERGINTAIRKLRRALRESASAPAYIETAPRVGYRLTARWWSSRQRRGSTQLRFCRLRICRTIQMRSSSWMF
jgi:DNA-binding winged helix-turn-helix (wHTH) protein